MSSTTIKSVLSCLALTTLTSFAAIGCDDSNAPPPATPASSAPSTSSASGPSADAPVDRDALTKALTSVDLSSCKVAGGPTGRGHASLSFMPDGSVAVVNVDAPPYAGTPAAACIEQKFRAVHVSPFGGDPVNVGQGFEIK